jgi:menaquinol-cytochrome c reductase iron-sulfur subunit
MCAAHSDPKDQPRRSFLKEALSVVIGGIVTLVPVTAGLVVCFDPLRKRSAAGAGGAIRVASLNALPNDGVPRKFPVIADKVDAWNKYPQVPVGAVYLRRTGDKTVEALNVVCPHAGGFVDYVPDAKCFVCPLHNSKFAVDGAISDPKSPSPRGMDPLQVEIRGTEIFVIFKNYRAGVHERIPVS